jgi:hypothetical protein
MSSKTKAELTTDAQVIRDETEIGANTKTRVYNILKDIIDSFFSSYEQRPLQLMPAGYNLSLTNDYPLSGGSGAGGSIQQGNIIVTSTTPGTLNVNGIGPGTPVGVGSWLIALIDDPGATPANWKVMFP